MSADRLIDPLFRLPFFTGLLFAALLPLVGVYLRLREEWLASLAYAQLAAAGSLGAAVLGAPLPLGALSAACSAAAAKGWLTRAGNNGYAMLMVLGWSAAVLVMANMPIAEHLGHALFDGQLFFTTWAHLIGAAVYLALCATLLPRLSRALLLERVLPDTFTANGSSPLQFHLAFNLLTAAGLALATASIGVMAAFALVFIPSMLAYQNARSWRGALQYATVIGVACYLAAFGVALILDQPFGPVMVLVLLTSAMAAQLLRLDRAAGRDSQFRP